MTTPYFLSITRFSELSGLETNTVRGLISKGIISHNLIAGKKYLKAEQLKELDKNTKVLAKCPKRTTAHASLGAKVEKNGTLHGQKIAATSNAQQTLNAAKKLTKSMQNSSKTGGGEVIRMKQKTSQL